MKLTKQMMEETGREKRVSDSVGRIGDFLERQAPDLAPEAGMPRDSFVREHMQGAKDLSIETEQGVARFCLLQLAFGGEALEVPEIKSLLTRPKGTPEEDLRNLIDGLAEAGPEGIG